MWRPSVRVRRVTAGSALVLLALAWMIVPRIPVPVRLPDKEVNARAVATSGQQIRIYRAEVGEGATVLHHPGAPNETAEIWLDRASLQGLSRAQMAGLVAPDMEHVIYAADEASPLAVEKNCRTEITIARATGAAPMEVLELAQKDFTPGGQQFRQLLLRAPGSALQIEVHADSAVAGAGGLMQCPRVLRTGAGQVRVPGGPLFLAVPDGWIDLRFSSADTRQPLWSKDDDALGSLELGDGGLPSHGLDVVLARTTGKPLLHVQPHGADGIVTVGGLKAAAQQLSLEVGTGGEEAKVYADGKPMTPFDPNPWIKENPVLGFLLASVLIPALWKICFPASEAKAAE